MGKPLNLVYVHFVWATRDRLPLLVGESKEIAYACIRSQCADLKAEVIALGGIEDHIHLLMHLRATMSTAGLIKRVKGASSRLVNERLSQNETFKWQGAYGAFSISPWDVSKVRKYILSKEEHHRIGRLKPVFERMETS